VKEIDRESGAQNLLRVITWESRGSLYTQSQDAEIKKPRRVGVFICTSLIIFVLRLL
jgi:hypothetical protein